MRLHPLTIVALREAVARKVARETGSDPDIFLQTVRKLTMTMGQPFHVIVRTVRDDFKKWYGNRGDRNVPNRDTSGAANAGDFTDDGVR